jgi:hypothetical protein
MSDIQSYLPTYEPTNYINIVGQTTGTVIKSSPGILHGVMINKGGSNAVITIYDNSAASGSTIATYTLSGASIEPLFVGPLDVQFLTGLTIKVGIDNNSNITIFYK